MREAGAKLGSDAMDYLKPQLHLIKGLARKEVPALARRLPGFVTPVALEG